ncbi:MAG: ATP-binding cassette domain-containing protein [Phycisphaerae bacterium]
MNITSYFTTDPSTSPTAQAINAAFGLGSHSTHKFLLCENLNVTLRPKTILFITGQSGSGKSCLLRILKRHHTPNIDLNKVKMNPKLILPDHFRLPLREALYYLSLAGLADAHIFLRTPHELSDGQLFRFKLALTLSKKPKYIIADQFLDSLDRLTAKILAATIRKFADKFSTTFILASPNNDFLDQLKPDIYIEKLFSQSPLIKEMKND